MIRCFPALGTFLLNGDNVNIKYFLLGNKDSSDPRPLSRIPGVNGTKWGHSGHAERAEVLRVGQCGGGGRGNITGLTHVGITQRNDRPGAKSMRDELWMGLFLWMSPNQFSEKWGQPGPSHAWAHWALLGLVSLLWSVQPVCVSGWDLKKIFREKRAECTWLLGQGSEIVVCFRRESCGQGLPFSVIVKYFHKVVTVAILTNYFVTALYLISLQCYLLCCNGHSRASWSHGALLSWSHKVTGFDLSPLPGRGSLLTSDTSVITANCSSSKFLSLSSQKVLNLHEFQEALSLVLSKYNLCNYRVSLLWTNTFSHFHVNMTHFRATVVFRTTG